MLRVLKLAYLSSLFQTGVRSPGIAVVEELCGSTVGLGITSSVAPDRLSRIRWHLHGLRLRGGRLRGGRRHAMSEVLIQQPLGGGRRRGGGGGVPGREQASTSARNASRRKQEGGALWRSIRWLGLLGAPTFGRSGKSARPRSTQTLRSRARRTVRRCRAAKARSRHVRPSSSAAGAILIAGSRQQGLDRAF